MDVIPTTAVFSFADPALSGRSTNDDDVPCEKKKRKRKQKSIE